MQVHMLSLNTPSTPRWDQKVKTLLSERSLWYPGTGVGSNGLNSFISESSQFAYQIEGNGIWSTMQPYNLSLHTTSTSTLGQKVKTFFFCKL